jgi:osmotically inducible protein OsmC
MNAYYTAVVTATGGRSGRVISSDRVIDLDVRLPKELGGMGKRATNPEQLFAAGYAACFDSALEMVMRQKRIKAKGTQVTASVSIGKDFDRGIALSVHLEVDIPGVDNGIAQELVHLAHQVCPYSKATRGNIDVITRISKPT